MHREENTIKSVESIGESFMLDVQQNSKLQFKQPEIRKKGTGQLHPKWCSSSEDVPLGAADNNLLSKLDSAESHPVQRSLQAIQC